MFARDFQQLRAGRVEVAPQGLVNSVGKAVMRRGRSLACLGSRAV